MFSSMENIQPEQYYLCLLGSFSYRIGSTVSCCVSLSFKYILSNIYFLTFFYLLSFMVQCQYLCLWLKKKHLHLKIMPMCFLFQLCPLSVPPLFPMLLLWSVPPKFLRKACFRSLKALPFSCLIRDLVFIQGVGVSGNKQRESCNRTKFIWRLISCIAGW